MWEDRRMVTILDPSLKNKRSEETQVPSKQGRKWPMHGSNWSVCRELSLWLQDINTLPQDSWRSAQKSQITYLPPENIVPCVSILSNSMPLSRRNREEVQVTDITQDVQLTLDKNTVISSSPDPGQETILAIISTLLQENKHWDL